MKKFFYLLLAMMLIGVSCEDSSKDVDSTPKGVVFASGTEMTVEFGSEGGSKNFIFTSDLDWEVTTSVDWISVTPSSGTPNEKKFTVKASANDSFEERSGTVTMTTTDDRSYTIEVTQAAENKTFTINGNGEYEVSAAGGKVKVRVTTNLEYTVEIPAEAKAWLSVADTRAVIREETLTFTVAENETLDERSATVELKGADGKVLQSIVFKQKGEEKVFDTDGEGNYIVEAAGGEVEVKVTTNLEYTVEIPAEAKAWLSVADTRAVREETLTLNVAKNEGSEKRSATVNLCAKGGDILQTITIKQSCANNEIIYTTKYGYPIELSTTDGFGGNIMSHNYANGYGRIIFDNDVVSIPNVAFWGCTTLTTIVLPNSLSTIDNFAFSGCTSLTSITIPDSVTTIGEEAFYGCTGKAIINCNIPGRTRGNDYHDVFYGAEFTEVIIGDSVTEIGAYAFLYCSSLTSITIPDSVTEIGDCAFYECSSLTSITIPDSVTEIGDYAFYECSSLTSVTIGDSVTSIGEEVFYGCTSLTSVAIGNGVTSIGDSAFSWCTSLTSVTIPDSVTTIGKAAFRGCNSLTSVVIPDSVTTIGGGAFSDCDSLTSVTIPDSVTTIGNSAFAACGNLISVTIPDSVTTIGNSAFYNCTSLTSVYCEATTPPSLGISAFKYYNEHYYNTINIRCPIYVPADSVEAYKAAENWSEYADYIVCYDFETGEAFVSQIKYTSTTKIKPYDPSAFNVAIISNEWDETTGEGVITFNGEITTIGYRAFYQCSSLTSVTIPDSVTTIGDEAFSYCYSLTSVTIPDSVTTIGEGVFFGCHSLTSVTIPNNVTTIGNEAFYFCDSLTSVYCKATTPPTLGGSYVFDGNKSGRKIYVPAESVEAYKAAENWSDYAADIVGYDFE